MPFARDFGGSQMGSATSMLMRLVAGFEDRRIGELTVTDIQRLLANVHLGISARMT
jgi:ABC-type thiamine transport system ATPase subunit